MVSSEYISKLNTIKFKTINAYMIALVCSAQFFARIFALLGFVDNGVFPTIVLMAVIISLFACLILTKMTLFQINKKSILLLGIILMFFLTSYFRLEDISYLNEFFIEFLFYGFIIFLITSMPFNYEKALKGVSLSVLVILINPIKVLDGLISVRAEATGDLHIDMGLSYAILPIVVAGILHMLFFSKKANLLVKLSYIINIILFILLLLFTVRGVMLSLGVLILLIVLNKNKKKYKTIMNIALYLMVLLFFIVIIKIEDWLLSFYNFLSTKGIEITALTKTVQKFQGGQGVLNGRDNLYENALSMIIDKPILGHGISYFSISTGGRFPHNIFLQSLLEYGFLFIILISIVVFLSLKISVESMDKYINNKGFKIFIVFCFVSSVPRLMVSSYLWKEQLFWMMIFIIFNYKNHFKNK